VEWVKKIRATDAKEVGVENPAEETFRRPNQIAKELPNLNLHTFDTSIFGDCVELLSVFMD
jgi:hypothetical protein